MSSDETMKYFDDSYSRVVRLRDGKPFEYSQRSGPSPKADEPALAREIEALTGYRVQLGEWEHLYPYNPLDEESRVPLTAIGPAERDR